MRATSWLVTGGVAVVVVIGLIQSGGVDPISSNPMAASSNSERTVVTVNRLAIDGSLHPRSSTVGNGGRLTLQAGYSVRSTSADPVIRAALESRTGSHDWMDTGADAQAAPKGALVVTTPAYSTESATETVEYRLVTPTSRSQTVTIQYENQNLYTGIAAEVYGYAARFCPSTAVHIESLSSERAGDFHTGGLLIRVSDQVGSEVNKDASSRRSLALHECAHERQWLNWGGDSTGNTTMTAASDRRFTEGIGRGDAVEHAADCAAQAFNPGGYLGYGGYCTSDEVDTGRRLLLGERY